MTIKLTIGADPEFFLKDKKTGENISAHDLVPGTKDKPHKMPSGGAIQADGTAVEFNIPPASTAKEFSEHIRAALSDIGKFVPTNRFEFDFSPSVVYKESYFAKIPESAKELGCDPDWSAHTMAYNPRPDNKTTMRTGAGHIHLGWGKIEKPTNPSHIWDCAQMTHRLDSYFGSFVKFWDTDTRRQKMYGAAGAFRPKPYGVEYRVLSNAWLKYPKLWPWIFESCRIQFESILEPTRTDEKEYNKLYERYYYYMSASQRNSIEGATTLTRLRVPSKEFAEFPADFKS